MLLSVEVSMYPLAEDYIPSIDSFIERLNSDALAVNVDIKVETFPTCTVIMGEHCIVMDLLKEAMAWSYENHGKAIFVTKFIHGYEAL